MSTHDPDGVPPVPTPPTDAAATSGEAAPAAHPSPEAAPSVPPASPEAAPSVPPAAPAYGPAGTPGNPYGGGPQQSGVPGAPPQQPYGGAPYQSYSGAPALPKGLSLTSMITGIAGAVLSLFSLGFLPALAGVIFGHIAQRKEPHAKSFWLTGIITGYAGVALSLLWGLVLFIPLMIVFFAGMGGAATY